MALSILTPEWTTMINKITIYVIKERMNDELKIKNMKNKPFDLFNQWANDTGVAVDNSELALWCVKYIQSIIEMPLSRLKMAADIDELQI